MGSREEGEIEKNRGEKERKRGGKVVAVSSMQSRAPWKTTPRPLDRWKSPPGISAAGHLLPDLEEKSTGEVDFERGYAWMERERERKRGGEGKG